MVDGLNIPVKDLEAYIHQRQYDALGCVDLRDRGYVSNGLEITYALGDTVVDLVIPNDEINKLISSLNNI